MSRNNSGQQLQTEEHPHGPVLPHSSSPRRGGDPEYASVPSSEDDGHTNHSIYRRSRGPSAPNGRSKISIIFVILAAVAFVFLGGWCIQRRLQWHKAAYGIKDSSSMFGDPKSDSYSSAAVSAFGCFDGSKQYEQHTIHYDSTLVNNHHISQSSERNDPFDYPNPPFVSSKRAYGVGLTRPFDAYLRQPHVVNNSIVLTSEGDLYYAQKNGPAMKLTSTVGNVLSPKIHLTRPLIAFTATYTGHRDAYVMNLFTKQTTRLTFGLDSYLGVVRIVHWRNETTLLVTAESTTSKHLPSVVLYELSLGGVDNDLLISPAVVQYRPVPLAQAIDGVYHGSCLFFVRYNQGSNTVRYVGGTVEQVWKYCEGDILAKLITPLQGTSKSPTIVQYNEVHYLLYLSDRDPASMGSSSANASVTTMNLWALPLNEDQSTHNDKDAVILTRTSCQFDGLTIREYSVDTVTGHIIVRIGGDLFQMKSSDIVVSLRHPGKLTKPMSLGIQVYSDFNSLQERLIPFTDDLKADVEVLTLASGVASLLTIRGQAWIVPILDSTHDSPYTGGGENMPRRRYRVVPSSNAGGSVRVLLARHVPLLLTPEDPRRLALVVATDPQSPTAEHALYLVEVHESAIVMDLKHPVLGGHVNGGSTRSGGLGSILTSTVSVSPCGRRVAWADTDGRICVWTLPTYSNQTRPYYVLPNKNEAGEPLDGSNSDLQWSPGGRYLSISHSAQNQFSVISIADCGDASPQNSSSINVSIPDIRIGRVVQVTSSRFNSYSVVWGKSSLDFYIADMAKQLDIDVPAATTLFFLTDRDIMTDVPGPWGSRAPQPHFPRQSLVYALPLSPASLSGQDWTMGRFAGGGAQEIFSSQSESLILQLGKLLHVSTDTPSARVFRRVVNSVHDDLLHRKLQGRNADGIVRWLEKASKSSPLSDKVDGENISTVNPGFPSDLEIEFGSMTEISFARRAYRMAKIPRGGYLNILSQLQDDPTLVLAELDETTSKVEVVVMVADDFPSDSISPTPVSTPTGLSLVDFSLSSSRKHLSFTYAPGNKIRVMGNTAASIVKFLTNASVAFEKSIADTSGLALSVIPRLEYSQMYSDTWRMLRDYFYDSNMHGVDWMTVFHRYLPLVDRCVKREDLDDILEQMASELSALHVFVYGGEYSIPFQGDSELISAHAPASFGVALEHAPEWKGYRIIEIPQPDPDLNLVNDIPLFCPLSSVTLRQSGQQGLMEGDIIVAVNGESTRRADIYSLLRGMEGRSVRIEVLRLSSRVNVSAFEVSNTSSSDVLTAETDSVIVTALSLTSARNLRYSAWEYKTQQHAQRLAHEAGFSVAYIHLRSMLSTDINDFARNFYPDYDKQALILDVRHNNGGNIDSWILTALQRKAWSYWKDRRGSRIGDIDWDEQFAFRGHIVVLINEKTGSDGEAVARGISELGLGRLIGTRTWGGGIWLSSDNKLVDGGIASAPETGTYNSKFGFGLGIENVGVEPDIYVDNNPRTAFDGIDTQLERAIAELKNWLSKEPVVIPNPPDFFKNVSISEFDCPA